MIPKAIVLLNFRSDDAVLHSCMHGAFANATQKLLSKRHQHRLSERSLHCDEAESLAVGEAERLRRASSSSAKCISPRARRPLKIRSAWALIRLIRSGGGRVGWTTSSMVSLASPNTTAPSCDRLDMNVHEDGGDRRSGLCTTGEDGRLRSGGGVGNGVGIRASELRWRLPRPGPRLIRSGFPAVRQR